MLRNGTCIKGAVVVGLIAGLTPALAGLRAQSLQQQQTVTPPGGTDAPRSLTEAQQTATARRPMLGDGTPCIFEAFPELPIPDLSPAGVSHTIDVPDAFRITDVNVALTITHTWVGDLCVQVSHNGVTVRLIQRPGVDTGEPCHFDAPYGCSENHYAGIVLDDEGDGGAIETRCLPDLSSPPSYTPNEALSAFDGMSAAGPWMITVSDNADFDIGVFNSWSLEFAAGGCGEPCPWDLTGNGSVGVLDLLVLLEFWNNPYGIPDLLGLLATWGPCP